MDAVIQTIISSSKIAVVGVSARKFGGTIYKELKKRGYEVVPIHPKLETFDNDRCYRSLTQIPKDITTAIIAVAPERALSVVNDAALAGVTHLWFQQGKNFCDAEQLAYAKNIKTVSGKCILMYAGPVTGMHALHRFLANLFKKY